MQNSEAITSIVLSAHALARIAAHDAGNDVPSAQWRTLSLLERRDGMRLGALAFAARITQPGMTRLVGTLEDEGLVQRSPDPDDSRATLVSATDRGRHAVLDWRKQMGETLTPRFDELSPEDWRVLRKAAEILAVHARGSEDHVDTTTNTTGERV